ncbi:MAG: FkbM family methyltransferase [Tatlockia sp.]|nr:FkbM family methyltransferase [Tatlockia sp.]
MNKTYRENVKIDVAFSSGLNNLRCANAVSEDSSALEINPGSINPPVWSIRSLVKKFIRQIAQVAYRFSRPLLKPVAFRLRHYFTHGLSERFEELQQITEIFKLELTAQVAQNQELLNTLARRVFIPCGDNEILVNTASGYLICSEKDRSSLVQILRESNAGRELLIGRFLKPGNVFFDVGANLGLDTLAAVKALQGRGKIIAFEALEEKKRLLEKSLRLNDFSALVTIYETGLTADPASIRLDDIDNQRVDLIKINNCGAEAKIIEGGQHLIKSNPDLALIVEFCPSRIKAFNYTIQQWLKTFSELALYYKVVNSETGVLENWSLKQLDKVESVNLLFARQDSSAWEKAGL